MDDLISRQAAIDYVDDVPYIKDHPNIALLWKAWVEQLPSAQPERKKGTWGADGECPFCGYLRQWDDDNFCGNCGADMRGESDE